VHNGITGARLTVLARKLLDVEAKRSSTDGPRPPAVAAAAAVDAAARRLRRLRSASLSLSLPELLSSSPPLSLPLLRARFAAAGASSSSELDDEA
jgi:hypothetical protein